MEDIDLKQLEDLKAILLTKEESGVKRERSTSTSNIMTFVAVLSAILALGGFLFAFVSGKIEPLNQTIGYMQQQETEMRASLAKQVDIDTESLKNRAALEEMLKEKETQLENFEEQVHSLKDWQQWWYKDIYPGGVDLESRVTAMEKRFEIMVADMHLMMRSAMQNGGGMMNQ